MKYLISEIKYIVKEYIVNRGEKASNIYKNIKNNGFHVIPNYISDHLITDLKEKINDYIPKRVSWVDEVKSDYRIFGIGKYQPEFDEVFHSQILKDVFDKYIDSRSMYAFTMANRVEFKEGNKGSGGGWHRDTINRRQLKFILYLSDVNIKSGCFEYLNGSHIVTEKLKINRLLNNSLSQYRYSDEEINKLINNYDYKKTSFIGPAGTLLIVDTSGIHRGKPIQENIRFAATRYMSDTKFSNEMQDLLI